MRFAGILALVAACSSSSPPAPHDVQGSPDVVEAGSADAAPDVVTDDRPDAQVPADTPAATDDRPDVVPADTTDAGLADAGPACVDNDRDTYGAGCAAGPDCDDGDPARHPGAREVCNGVDDNCDGIADVLPDAGAGQPPYDPAVREHCRSYFTDIPVEYVIAPADCVLPTMPAAFHRCSAAGSIRQPSCVLCWRMTATRNVCEIRAPMVTGRCAL